MVKFLFCLQSAITTLCMVHRAMIYQAKLNILFSLSFLFLTGIVLLLDFPGGSLDVNVLSCMLQKTSVGNSITFMQHDRSMRASIRVPILRVIFIFVLLNCKRLHRLFSPGGGFRGGVPPYFC